MSGDHRLRECLEGIYTAYNRRELIHPDPLEFLWRYEDTADREIAGLVASGLAYGRVAQILASTEKVLSRLGPFPSRTLRGLEKNGLAASLEGFRHRFTTSGEMMSILASASSIQSERGLMGNLLAEFVRGRPYHEALDAFAGRILAGAGLPKCSLLPRPGLGSACKRLHLFMRWMVRSDDVDPGGWDFISPSLLMVPVDVHMFRLSRALGLTRRNAADHRTAVEVTEGFRRINPDDPVKYDFALTRMGIQGREKDELFTDLRSNHCLFIDTGR
ncbi:MAG: TIGR02757 family protein [Candidatus Fermentibacteraceae bacterium]|nr:TIGR02757 family protein [Candidatus Fermentibacteraceae bacterium]MBN2608077.1 TIGR02757 family protein [Candidatus Fermentibacteraceae bacterium]